MPRWIADRNWRQSYVARYWLEVVPRPRRLCRHRVRRRGDRLLDLLDARFGCRDAPHVARVRDRRSTLGGLDRVQAGRPLGRPHLCRGRARTGHPGIQDVVCGHLHRHRDRLCVGGGATADVSPTGSDKSFARLHRMQPRRCRDPCQAEAPPVLRPVRAYTIGGVPVAQARRIAADSRLPHPVRLVPIPVGRLTAGSRAGGHVLTM